MYYLYAMIVPALARVIDFEIVALIAITGGRQGCFENKTDGIQSVAISAIPTCVSVNGGEELTE